MAPRNKLSTMSIATDLSNDGKKPNEIDFEPHGPRNNLRTLKRSKTQVIASNPNDLKS